MHSLEMAHALLQHNHKTPPFLALNTSQVHMISFTPTIIEKKSNTATCTIKNTNSHHFFVNLKPLRQQGIKTLEIKIAPDIRDPFTISRTIDLSTLDLEPKETVGLLYLKDGNLGLQKLKKSTLKLKSI